jgi:peptidoglycan/xylan/chitin deacetylase (PgdA/CDA1 family)
MAKSVWKNFLLEKAENIGFLNFVQESLRGSDQSVYILAYHRVDDLDHRPWLDPGLISATPRQFEDQMRLVASRYHPITAVDLVEAAHGGNPLPKDAVLVTVDDGYRDFQEVIVPICSRYGIRPLLFVPTAFVGTGTFWWDKVYQIIFLSGLLAIETPVGQFSISTADEKLKAYTLLVHSLKFLPDQQLSNWVETTHAECVELSEEQQQNTLSWSELADVARAGVSVACHTHTHPIMSQISTDEARRQVRVARELLQQNLGHSLPIFAFPDGKRLAFNAALFDMLHSEGFEILLTLVGGRALVKAGSKNLVLPRLSVWRSQTLPQFHMRLTPLMGRGRIH